jgi:hypothetical protein
VALDGSLHWLSCDFDADSGYPAGACVSGLSHDQSPLNAVSGDMTSWASLSRIAVDLGVLPKIT